MRESTILCYLVQIKSLTFENCIVRTVKPELFQALIFVMVALITLLVGHHYRNIYLIFAAGILTVATYLIYPPTWIVKLIKPRNPEKK